MKKLIIAHIAKDTKEVCLTETENYERNALNYFLKNHCGYNVLQYENKEEFIIDLPRLKKYYSQSQLILVIIEEEKYSNQHEEIYKIIRDQISTDIPIVMRPDKSKEDLIANRSDKKLHILYGTETKFINFIKRLMTESKPFQNYFGVETIEDQGILMDNLENAYRHHYLNIQEDKMLGTPDNNHMIVAEALRLRLSPCNFREEFDNTIPSRPQKFSSIESSIYDAEIKRIKEMDASEKQWLERKIWQLKGYENDYKVRAGCSKNVNGFAIDPVTLETLITNRSSEHYYAGQKLAHRIQIIEALKKGKHYYYLSDEEKGSCRRRLITGLIFFKLNDFETPLLQFFEQNNASDLKKITQFILKQKMFIPIDQEMNIPEG